MNSVGNAGRWCRRLALLTLGAVLSVGGCDCSESTAAVYIVQPAEGAQITLADDLDADPTNGIQYDVVANTLQIDGGEALELRIDGEVVATAPVDGSANRVTFPSVTLPDGHVELWVCHDGCAVQSNRVRVRVELECPSMDFITPAPPAMDDVRVLGPDDDTDGEPCGATFTTDFQVVTSAGLGHPIQLEVNGNIAASTTVGGTIVTFPDVALDRRGAEDPNTVRVVVESQAGVACPSSYPSPIVVDCEGVSCVITAPQPEGGLLGMADDADGDPDNGLQIEAEVTTAIEAVGQPVQLLTNDVPRATATVQGVSGQGIATFPLELQEGAHRAQAICRDAVGNETHSAEVHWTVDLTPCEVTIDQIAGHDAALPALERVITPDDDLDEQQSGTQVALVGTVSGDGCEDIRVGVCSGSDPSLEGAELTPLEDEGSYERVVTLGSGPTQHVCAQVRDAAGNLSALDPVQVQFASDAPAVQLWSPVSSDRVNADGGAFEVDGEPREYIVDLDPSTTRCEAAFEVLCQDTRGTVRVIHQASGGDVVLSDTVDCEDEAGLPWGFAGVARFASVPLPTLSGTPFTVVAEHRVGSVTPGVSEPVVLRADCNPPRLLLVTPSSCPAVLDPEGGELEFDITAGTSAQDVQDPAVLRIFEEPFSVEDPPHQVLETDFLVLSQTSRRAIFEGVSFASAGDYFFDVCASDDMDNQGCVDCQVTVGDLPSITFVEPVSHKVHGASDDCDTERDGFQIQVTATTDAPDGADAVVRTGEPGHPQGAEQETTVVGGTIAMCLDAPQGSDVPIEVRVTHPLSNLTASRTVHVDIDSMPPTEPIDDLAMVDPQPQLPRHAVRFQWTAVPDGDGGALARYEMRCADVPITAESDWDAATVHAFDPPVSPVAPGDPPATQAGNVTGFEPGRTRHCVLRAADRAEEMTPLGNSVQVVTQALRSFTIRADGSAVLGTEVHGVGDVNGDGLDDLLIGGRGAAYLYFGRGDATVDGATVTPDVTLRGEATDEFGSVIAPLGDVNGDGRPDFAVGAFNHAAKGAVYLFHGRSSDDPWESVIEVAGGGCQASVCLLMDDGVDGSGVDENAFFGFSIAGLGDFDGDGVGDLAVGAPGTLSNTGRVYVLVGGRFTEGQTVRVPRDSVDGWALEPDAAMDRRLGWDMAGLGRAVGGDPLTDLAFSATGTGGGPQGALYIFRGRVLGDSGLQVLDMASALATGSVLEVQRATFGGTYGFQVANVGDMDGDGHVEIAVRHAGREWVDIFEGALSGYSPDHMSVVSNDSASPSGDQFGQSVAAGMVPGLWTLADVNGDGLADLFVGSLGDASPPGVGQVFNGEPELPSSRDRSTADLTLDPPADDASAARNVGYAGDLDGDGAMDLAVGDPRHGGDQGQVVVYY